MTTTASGLREVACNLFLQSLADCSIEQAVIRKVKRISGAGDTTFLTIGDDIIDLGRVRRIGVVAVGKAASTMLKALLPSLQGLSRCDLSGVLIANDAPPDLPRGFQFFAGGHPTPNQASIDGAEAALALVRSLRKQTTAPGDSLCLFLVSGGASAMMELPIDSNISLEDMVKFHRELVHCGGSIAEINCVRKHFSAVKGGRLALEAESVPSYSLLVSDVPLRHLDALGSGPTLPDSSTVDQCKEILERYGLMDRFPASVRQFFSSTQLRETPNSAQLRSRAVTLLSSEDLVAIVEQRARDLGFYAVVDNTCDDWRYNTAAEYLLERLRDLRRDHRRVCLISSGEVTVELFPGISDFSRPDGDDKLGVGGRNQHFALYAATLLRPSDARTVVLSAGTDGIDGNSFAAGAVVDETLLDDEKLMSQAQHSLKRFDSGTFLQGAGLNIVTGATGNNLRDLRILLADEC
jgi:glycerate 2-kinase